MARQRILPDWISIDWDSSEPLYRQISRQIELAVEEKRLAPGTYLPASRTLAAHLGVSRLTVLSAYDLLVADGLLETTTGSGTRVSTGLLGPGPTVGTGDATVPDVLGNRLLVPVAAQWLTTKSETVAFRTGISALDQFPRRVWSRLLRRHGLRGDPQVLNYGRRSGYGPLREMIARYLATSRGVRCATSQVIVVGSTRAGLSLACSVLTTWGDTAVWGDPGYHRAHANFELSGQRLAPVLVGDEGLGVSDLRSQAPGARLAYVTPGHHWPTGVTLSSSRRQELLAWAREHKAWILEDDYDSEFHFDGPPSRPLKAEPDSDQVIFLGTFAKTLAPSIHCAYLVVPESLEARFGDHAVNLGITPAVHVQAALADFMNEGYFTRYIQKMRRVYHARRDELEWALADTFGDRISVRHPKGGLQLIADLPADISAATVSERAPEWNLAVCPMSDYYFAYPPPNALHLGFAPVPEPDIAPAVRRLAEVIETSG